MDVSVIIELTDAMRTVRGADLLDRDRLCRLLMVTLAKRAADMATLGDAVDLLFPTDQQCSRRGVGLPALSRSGSAFQRSQSVIECRQQPAPVAADLDGHRGPGVWSAG